MAESMSSFFIAVVLVQKGTQRRMLKFARSSNSLLEWAIGTTFAQFNLSCMPLKKIEWNTQKLLPLPECRVYMKW